MRSYHTTISEAALYQEAEAKTNRDNLIGLTILAVVLLLCEFLNDIKVFEVSPIAMRIGTACGMICYLLPVAILFRQLHPFMRKAEKPEYKRSHKYLILAFSWLGTAAACITLTHHTVIVMAVPIMLVAQYQNTKKLLTITAALGTVCVLLGVYGGYFWGCFDGNLLHLASTADNVADLALRVQMATPKRMSQLLTHYALPRELVVLSLTFLATRISRRSDEMLKRQAELQMTVEKEMQRTNGIQEQIISGMANLIENRDSSTGEHVKRTSFYVQSIVEKLQVSPHHRDTLPAWKADTIIRAAPLHDIGKIVIADRILQKPGKLTADEYKEIMKHSAEGAKVIKNVLGNVEDDDFLRTASEIAGGHHERWDGKGYPDGLKGEDIPLSARIMAVADVFDALVSKRVYKEPMPPEDAFTIIESESGKQFDPEVVQALISLKPDILSYLQKNL